MKSVTGRLGLDRVVALAFVAIWQPSERLLAKPRRLARVPLSQKPRHLSAM